MIPDIRFKSDQSKWTENTLGKFITVHSERNSIRNDNVLSVSNTKGFIHQSEQFDNHIVASNDTSNYKIVKSDWFAYNPARINVGSIAKNNLNETGIVSPMYEVFECNTDVLDSNYLNNLYKDNRFNHWVVQQIQGTVRQCLKIENMKAMPVSLPDIEVQKKISALLSNIDLKIKNQQKKVDKIKEFKQAMLIKMFPQEGRKVPEIRFEGFTDDWEQRKLGDIADVTKLAGFEFTEHVVYSDEGNIIALRGLNIKNGQLALDDIKYIDGSNFSKLNRSKLYIDDIMFTYVGTIGEVAIIKENDRFYLAPNVSRIRIQSDDSPKFISHYMRTDYFYKLVIYPLIATSSQPALSMENIRKFKICLPQNRKEQARLSEWFDELDHLITLHQCKCDKLIQIKKALLYKLMPVRS